MSYQIQENVRRSIARGRFLVVVTLLLTSLLLVSCGVAREDYEAVVAERAAAQTQVKSLRSDLDNIENRIETLETDLAEVQAKVAELQAQLEAERAKIKELSIRTALTIHENLLPTTEEMMDWIELIYQQGIRRLGYTAVQWV